MTYRETERWLNRGRNAQHEIEVLNKRLNEANDRATSTTSSLDAVVVQGSKDPHKFDIVAELTSSIYEQLHKLDMVLGEIQRTVNQIEDSKQREVLSRYYIDSARVNLISLEMGCSDAYIYSLKRKGVKAVKLLLEYKKV